MATRDQVIDRIEKKLIQVHQSELQWTDITSAIGNSGTTNKNLIVSAIKNKEPSTLADLIFTLVSDKITADAKAEAATMVADDNLSLTELQRIF